jgi:peroxiredoxin
MPKLAVGQIVPEFAVQRRIRQPVSLSELVAERPAVLHVYIFDFTGSHEGGWQLQVARFGRAAPEFEQLGLQVYGLSQDAPASHEEWARQLEERGMLGGQELLSDWNKEATRALGVYRDEVIGFRPLNVRGAFLVDSERVCRYAWSSEDLRELPDPEPVLAAARAL